MAGIKPLIFWKSILIRKGPLSRPRVATRGLRVRGPYASVLYQTEYLMRLQPLSPLEKRQFHKKRTSRHLSSGLLDQFAPGFHGAAGGEQVIDEQDAMPLRHAVDVNLQHGAAVLKIVLQGMRAIGQLSRFSQGHKWLVHAQGQRCSEEEATGFRGSDCLNVVALIPGSQPINGFLKRARLGEQRRNILEENARFGKI